MASPGGSQAWIFVNSPANFYCRVLVEERVAAISDAALKRDGEIISASVGTEEIVMLSVKAGRYYGLNAVGRRLWELLEQPRTRAELRAAICAEFEVDEATCEADIAKFLGEMIDNGLVHAAEA